MEPMMDRGAHLPRGFGFVATVSALSPTRYCAYLDRMIKKLTPVLMVDAIEPVLPLWDALGCTRAAEVPHGDRLGFVILQTDAVEVMYQTFDSVRADEP